MQALIFILLYDDNVVLFACTLGDMQHLHNVLARFHQISGIIVNVDKTKMMAIITKTIFHFYIQGRTNKSSEKLQISW